MPNKFEFKDYSQFMPFFLDNDYFFKSEHKEIWNSKLVSTLDYKQSYLLSGKNETGKTTKAVLAMRDYCTNIFPNGYHILDFDLAPYFMDGFNLVENCLNLLSYDDDVRYQSKSILKELKTSKMAVIDDLMELTNYNKRELTEIRRQMYDIMEYRSGHRLVTIITTNLTFNQIKNDYGEKTANRIGRLVGKNVVFFNEKVFRD